MKIIDYTNDDLILYPGPTRLPLTGEITLRFTGRECAGRWQDGEYVPCDSPTSPYCPDCESVWPYALCKGDCLLGEVTCLEEHSVYLALFRPNLIKVGVTRAWRLPRRLKEQGADAGVEITKVANGQQARVLEQELTRFVPDRIATAAKLRGFDQPIDHEQWESVKERITEYVGGQPRPETWPEYFDEKPWMQPIPLTPHVDGGIHGKVFGVKGRYLVLERMESLYAVDLDTLLGFEVENGLADDVVQSSLHSF